MATMDLAWPTPFAKSAHGPFSGTGAELGDADIRAAVRCALSVGHRASEIESTVVDEVAFWRGYVRADLVESSSRALRVFEFKSDRDRLTRFGEQMRIYDAVADRVTVVVGWNLAAQVLRQTPNWYEVWLAERAPGADVALVPLRDGSWNPAVDPFAMARLLPVTFALRAFEARAAAPRLRGKRGHAIRAALVDLLGLDELRVEVARWIGMLVANRNGGALQAVR